MVVSADVLVVVVVSLTAGRCWMLVASCSDGWLELCVLLGRGNALGGLDVGVVVVLVSMSIGSSSGLCAAGAA